MEIFQATKIEKKTFEKSQMDKAIAKDQILNDNNKRMFAKFVNFSSNLLKVYENLIEAIKLLPEFQQKPNSFVGRRKKRASVFGACFVGVLLALFATVPLYSFDTFVVPGLSPLLKTDRNGRSCRGEVKLPFCRGFCKSKESGTHSFPHREQEAYFCGIVTDNAQMKNVTLDECEEGADEEARLVQISTATECKCIKMT
ncbi:hypothetical protein niasHT_033924 [Heterodera trifolii]|uniref:Uncharacterized protein n=1 Tax=Heterodera trifolii TaxID=157864 RepID=A0ABD2HQY5_9BILA